MSDATLLSGPPLPELEEEPIMVTLTGEDIGHCFARSMKPYEFNQYVLAALRQAGAPIEGSGEGFLKVTRGVVTRMKSHPRGFGYFGYMWLSQQAWDIVQSYGRESGLEAYASGVVN